MTRATERDVVAVRERLGREPQAEFEVVVRDETGAPVVLRNEPFTAEGRPMPTLYWLVDPDLVRRVSRLESTGGVTEAERAVPAADLSAAHAVYAAERDALVSADRPGPRPTGGVAGTRQGVKCLHAHYAWFLAGGDDPVGRWVAARLEPGTDESGDDEASAVDGP